MRTWFPNSREVMVVGGLIVNLDTMESHLFQYAKEEGRDPNLSDAKYSESGSYLACAINDPKQKGFPDQYSVLRVKNAIAGSEFDLIREDTGCGIG